MRVRSRLGALPIAVLVVVASALYVALALAEPIPGVFPDEFLYQHLAQSLAAGHGFTWRGQDESLKAALYVYYITPAWLASSGVDAYKAAKVASAIASCMTVIPVWLAARMFMSRAAALIPALLAVAGTWMLSSANLLTEDLAFPLATASLMATVAILRRPGGRMPWIALGFALLATWARLQLVVLLPAIFVACLLDVARAGPERGGRLRAHRPLLLTTGGLVVIGLIVWAIGGSSTAGIYSTVLDYHPGVGAVLRKTGVELIALTAMSGYFPVLLAFALSLSARAWRDEAVGPLLAVFWPATLLLALESGFFLAGLGIVPWGVDRYVAYTVPVALLLTFVALARPGLVSLPRVALGGVASLLLLLAPSLQDVSEERALGATITRVHDVIGGASSGASLLIAALVACVAVALVLRVTDSRRALAMGALLLALLATMSVTAWNRTLGIQDAYRTFFPHDLRWVDDHSDRSVAMLAITRNPLGYEQYEFFNEKIARYYSPQVPVPGRGLEGRACKWAVGKDGTVTFDKACGSVPRRFLVNDPTAHVTFYDESDVATDPQGGRLVTVRGAPRVRTLVYMPCEPRRIGFTRPWGDRLPASRPVQCAQDLRAYVWVNSQTTLVVQIKGGIIPHLAQADSKQYQVPEGTQTTLRIPVRAGGDLVDLLFDWAGRGRDEPEVTGVGLDDGGGPSSVL